jgi:hypothetical protein
VGDVVQLSLDINGTGLATFSDLASVLSDDGAGNAVLNLGDGNAITFIGVQVSDFAADDFLFG